jgi:DNA-binding LacI/PurR family transcriptional regulator
VVEVRTVPALVTVRMPTREIVVEGVTMAIEIVRNPTMSREARVSVSEPILVVGGSTAPPAQRAPVVLGSETERADG